MALRKNKAQSPNSVVTCTSLELSINDATVVLQTFFVIRQARGFTFPAAHFPSLRYATL